MSADGTQRDHISEVDRLCSTGPYHKMAGATSNSTSDRVIANPKQ